MKNFILFSLALFTFSISQASELKLNESAPLFKAKTDEGKTFDLNSRKGHWTVLYFYPKSETPGCTKQACAYRDNIKKVQATGAEVFGISADTAEDQAAFRKNHHLNFTLLADPEDKVINLFGTKMSDRNFSKRWTFVIDPALKIRAINKDVDPVLDAENVAKQIAELKSAAKK